MKNIHHIVCLAVAVVASTYFYSHAQVCLEPVVTSGDCTSMPLNTPLLMMCDNCGWLQYGYLSSKTLQPGAQPTSTTETSKQHPEYGNTTSFSVPCYFKVSVEECENCHRSPATDSWQYDSMTTTCCCYYQTSSVPETYQCSIHGSAYPPYGGNCPYFSTKCEAED